MNKLILITLLALLPFSLKAEQTKKAYKSDLAIQYQLTNQGDLFRVFNSGAGVLKCQITNNVQSFKISHYTDEDNVSIYYMRENTLYALKKPSGDEVKKLSKGNCPAKNAVELHLNTKKYSVMPRTQKRSEILNVALSTDSLLLAWGKDKTTPIFHMTSVSKYRLNNCYGSGKPFSSYVIFAWSKSLKGRVFKVKNNGTWKITNEKYNTLQDFYTEENVCDSQAQATKHKSITIMSYNLQNLFDTVHDQGKEDYEFLPKTSQVKEAGCDSLKKSGWRKSCKKADWTEKKLNLKLQQIQKVISHNFPNELPHILAVQEVENINVLSMLAKKLGYKNFILEEGPDTRGIDTGFLYRKDMKYKSHRLFPINGGDRPTRGALAAYFKVGRKDLAVYNIHWPSQGAPTKVRTAVAEQIKKYIMEDTKKNPRLHIVVTGDFNVTYKEEEIDKFPPIAGALLNEKKADSQFEGLLDTYALNSKDYNSKLPRGTYYYRRDKVWSLFDRFLISKNLNDDKGLDIEENAYTIHGNDMNSYNQKCHTGWICNENFNIPNRYNFRATDARDLLKLGYSDHYPISLKLKFK